MSSMHLQGEMMDAVGGGGDAHHLRHVLTDLTLSIAQDSGWCASMWQVELSCLLTWTKSICLSHFITLEFSPWMVLHFCHEAVKDVTFTRHRNSVLHSTQGLEML